MEEEHIIGIDFGTTYSCVGVWANGGVIIIPNELSERTTPSVVIFENKNEVYVCEETYNHLSKKKSVKIYEIKRLLGKKYSEIEQLKKYFPFTIEKDKDGDNPIIKIEFEDGEIGEYTPEYISSLILKKLILNAELFLNKKITDIVITVPADFSDNQRHAIKFSAESIPGIKVRQLINEPSAAALAAGFFSLKIKKNTIFNYDEKKNYLLGECPHPMEINDKNSVIDLNDNCLNFSLILTDTKGKENEDEKKYILVFDLGGGTYDVSLIEKDEAMFETIATAGEQMLGGGDFDNILIEYCLDNFSNNIKIDKNIIKEDYKAIQRLKIACEQTKKTLSFKLEDKIYIEDFYKEESLSISIKREKFEDLCKELFDKISQPLDRVIEDAKKKKVNKIDEIILVGGSSKIPKIKNILSGKFKNIPINDSINPDEAVAYGAALFCEKLKGNNNELLEDFDYYDTTQHSYGIEVENGLMDIIIPRGSNYPTNVIRYFHNYFDYQTTFEIKVYEGEDKLCKNNILLGSFTLENLPGRPKGELICTVNFTIDMNQILRVNAYVGDEIKNGIIISSDNQFINKTKIIFEDINKIETNLNEKEKQIKLNITNYTNNFNKMKNNEEKFTIIKNYNEAVISYLTFLEEKCGDIESEKYLYLVEKLFKSYNYLYSTNLYEKLSADDKIIIENNVQKYIKIVGLKNPFKLKQLIMIFENIKRERSEIFYSSSILCMEVLFQKAEKIFNIEKKNGSLIAKNFYEECLSIANTIFKDDKTLALIQNNLKLKYEEIKEKCGINIIIIFVKFFDELQNTQETGELFSNYDIDYDNLCLLSFNFSQCLKKINTIKNLNKYMNLLEMKSICLANIVKIEYLMKKRRLTLKNLLQYAEESISIVDSYLEENYKELDWYKEIVDIKEKIKNEINENSKTPEGEIEIESMRKEFNEKYYCGEEEFLKFLLDKYPYKGYNKNDNIIQEYKKDKKKCIKKLLSKYKKYDSRSTLLSDKSLSNLTQKKEIILEYITNILNYLNQMQ